MNYAITATLGPASREAATWRDMLSAGVTSFRLNTSHLTTGQVGEWLERLAGFFQSLDSAVPVVLDLQGSKWRVGQFETLELRPGQLVKLCLANEGDPASGLPVPHADFFQAARQAGREILLNDAKIQLDVQSLGETYLTARVAQGGMLSAHKGLTFRESDYRVETIREKDRAIAEQFGAFSGVRFAVSYVRDGREMERYRHWLGSEASLIAKLERGPAMQDALEMAHSANELWVCRGDLGAELGLAGMARSVARFSDRISEISVPVLMAGQVLEHMTHEAAPTRSEVCYLLDSLSRGYRGFVLSDEAAIGSYPVESCRAAAMFRS